MGPGRGDGWRRLHPLSPLVRSYRGVLAVLALTGLSASGAVGSGNGPRWYDLALAVVVAAAAIVNWLVTRWKLDGVTLRIETGLLRRDSRQLPVARIQAVDLVRPFLARMLGLAELRVRLAGSGHADGRLAYLTEQSAVALRARLLAAHHGLDPATPEPAEQIVTSVPAGRLIGSAAISTVAVAGVVVVAGLVVAAFSPAGLIAAAGSLVWWLVIGAMIAWRHVSSQYAFTVAASPDGVRIRRGLLATVAETIPVQRVQAVRMVEPLLWRPFHWCRLEVDVAGNAGREGEGRGSVRKALLPVGGPGEAARLLRIALPRARLLPAPGDGSAAALPPPGRFPVPPRLSPFTAPPPRRARWKAPLSYHFLAAGHDGTLAVAVTGRVRRETVWVPLAKAQSVRFVQGPLQRWLRLATVHLDAAGRHVRAEFRERGQEEARSLVTGLAALSRSARRQEARGPLAAPGPPAAVPGPPPIAPGPPPAGQDQAASDAPPVNASQRDA
jgi:putative membrane protein